MVDKGIGDYFISDTDEETLEDDELLTAPVVVPVTPVMPVPAPAPVPAQPVAPAAPVQPVPQPMPAPAPQPVPVQPVVERSSAAVGERTREERLAQALDELMHNDRDIQAAALVSLDGFTMASALPQGMQADRVGAMSAAILGLGERAAAELGRGHLSQVFIEGENGYVLLIAAGDRAVLTAMADPESKLGLVLYDMKVAAESIGRILG